MITKEQYDQAVRDQEKAEKIINQYHKERDEAFEKRMNENPIFKVEELCFSAYARCDCGSGLAYPKECSPRHYWDCAEILLGIADTCKKHTAKLPFAFYEIKSEDQPSAEGNTTRPEKT